MLTVADSTFFFCGLSAEAAVRLRLHLLTRGFEEQSRLQRLQVSQNQSGVKQEQVFRLQVTSSCLQAKVLCFLVLATELVSSAAEFCLHSNNLWTKGLTHMLISVHSKIQKNSQLFFFLIPLFQANGCSMKKYFD